jgi:hypothetical protein
MSWSHLLASNEWVDHGLVEITGKKVDVAPLLTRMPGEIYDSGPTGDTITIINPADPAPVGPGCAYRVRLIGFHDENPGFGKTFEVRVGSGGSPWTRTFPLDAPKPISGAWRPDLWWWLVLPPDVPQDEIIEVDVPADTHSRRIFVGDYVDVTLNLQAGWIDLVTDVAEVQSNAPGSSASDGRFIFRRDRTLRLLGLTHAQFFGAAFQPPAANGQHQASVQRIFDYAGVAGEVALLPRAWTAPITDPAQTWPLFRFGVYGRFLRAPAATWLGLQNPTLTGTTPDAQACRWSTDTLTLRGLR